MLRLLIQCRSNKLISRELALAESTVKTHLAAVFRKLSAGSRTQTVVEAAHLRLAPQGLSTETLKNELAVPWFTLAVTVKPMPARGAATTAP